jgi:large subunit ribosomal protein L21
MFAVIEDGSRQYQVSQGDVVTLDYRSEANAGDAVTFDRVLMANGGGASAIGRPVLEGATVEGEIVKELFKGPKLEVQKIRRRKNSRTHTGHRQKHTTIRITKINVLGLEIVEPPVEETAPAPEPAVTELAPVEAEAVATEVAAETAAPEASGDE